MKSLKLASIAASALLLSSVATAGDMYIDLGTNSYDSAAIDANSTTGLFNELSFSQLWATSIYDYSDTSIFGSFFDTNILSELNAVGVPGSGPTLAGGTGNLVLPNCAAGQCDIDALSPLAPPLSGSDREGFLTAWDLQMEYKLNGVLTPSGPAYTGGFLNIFFNDFSNDANDRLVLTLSLTGSSITAANLFLFFDITFAETGFLWVDNGSGTFIDAATGVLSGEYARATLNTNVNPPIPTDAELVRIGDNVIRQSRLNGGITASIPEPASLAVLGLGLLGLAASGTRKRKSSK